MSPVSRVRDRLNVVLQMVTLLIAVLLIGQLWLFSVTLDAMENGALPPGVAAAAAAVSLLACGTIWTLIHFFIRTEQSETGERA